MTYFLTSSPCLWGETELCPNNRFAEELKKALAWPCAALFICSSPDDYAKTERFAGSMRDIFRRSGFAFRRFEILDRRNEKQAAALVERAELIFLAGGHVPTQNRFFAQIGLRELLKGYEGVVIGISAGTMNSAELVYAQPELEGEAVSKEYRRFLPGLGLTKTMVLPHYQLVKNDVLDGLRVFEDIAYPDSMGRCFYALPDGSYLFGKDGKEELRGEAWRIKDGRIEKICENGQSIVLHT